MGSVAEFTTEYGEAMFRVFVADETKNIKLLDIHKGFLIILYCKTFSSTVICFTFHIVELLRTKLAFYGWIRIMNSFYRYYMFTQWTVHICKYLGTIMALDWWILCEFSFLHVLLHLTTINAFSQPVIDFLIEGAREYLWII